MRARTLFWPTAKKKKKTVFLTFPHGPYKGDRKSFAGWQDHHLGISQLMDINLKVERKTFCSGNRLTEIRWSSNIQASSINSWAYVL